MTQGQIENSLTAKRLPYSYTDWFAAIFFIAFIGVMIYISISPPHHGEPFPLFMSVGFSGVAILIGVQKLYFNQTLKFYASDLTIPQKQRVLERMLAGSDMIEVKSQSAQYADFTYKTSLLTKYHIRLLYDDSGYYINSLKGEGRSEWFADKGVSIITGLIQATEEETSGSKSIPASMQ